MQSTGPMDIEVFLTSTGIEEDDVRDRTVVVIDVLRACSTIATALRHGASGFILKNAPPEQLVDAVRTVAAGDALLAPSVTRRIVEEFARRPAWTAATDVPVTRLTDREREVLRHIARGFTYKVIAQRLHISVKTVETHVSAVLRKLQLSNRHELTRWATDRRLV